MRKNHKYDFKKQIYLDILETVIKSHEYFLQIGENYNSSDRLSPEDLKNFDPIRERGFIDKYRLLLAGANEDVIQLIDQIYDPDAFKDLEKIHKLFREELIPKMINDLDSSRTWWKR